MKKLITLLLCILLVLSGCAKPETSDTNTQTNYTPKEKEEFIYTSKIKKESCYLCSKAGKTLLPAYAGQNNVGIICINTFDMSPVTINRYDDHGNLIEEPAGYMSTTHNSFGEDGISTSVMANPDRGHADVHVYLKSHDSVNKKSVESMLCQNCLTAIMDEAWDAPYGIGVINFETLEVRLFEENITAFTFGDYYIDIDRRANKDNPEDVELDLLIFYCPPRYE